MNVYNIGLHCTSGLIPSTGKESNFYSRAFFLFYSWHLRGLNNFSALKKFTEIFGIFNRNFIED